MLAFGSFVGFEATALYGEESRNPHRSVPRATYISLALITVFYLFTSWAAISSYGVHHAQAAAAANPSMFIFAQLGAEARIEAEPAHGTYWWPLGIGAAMCFAAYRVMLQISRRDSPLTISVMMNSTSPISISACR